MSQKADIEITIRGSSAETIRNKAGALNSLALSLYRLDTAMKTAGGGSIGVNAAASNVMRYSRAATTAKTRTDAFGTSLGGAGNALDNFGTLFTRMIRIMTAYFIISKLTSLTKDFITALASAPAKMELWSTQVRVLVGDATLAAEKLGLLKDVAVETPLKLPDLFEGLTVLQAFRVEVSQRTLPLLADLAAVSGRTFRDISEVIGKVIAGSAPAITRSLPTLGIDPNEFKRLAAQLGNRSDAIFQIIQEKFGGFAKESAKTVIGTLSNIGDAFFTILADIGSGLLPLEERIFGGIFQTLQNLRKNGPELDRLRVTVRLVADDLLDAGKNVIDFTKFIWSLVQALGGLKSILEVLVGVWIGRFVSMTALGLASINPWTIALVSLAGIVSIINGKMSQNEGANNRARVAQEMFTESLRQTNEQYLKNINLVDAAVAKRQSETLFGFFDQADDIFGRLKSGSMDGLTPFLDRLKQMKDVLPAGVGNAIDAMQLSIDGLNTKALSSDEAFRRMGAGMVSIMRGLFEGAAHFNDIAVKAQKAADTARNSLLPALGEVTRAIPKEGPFDHWRSEAAAKFFEYRYIKPVQLALAQVTLSGIKNKGVADQSVRDSAVAQLQLIRGQLVEEADKLMSLNPIDVTAVLKLTAQVQNIDTDINKLVKDPVSDALESALRSAIKQGADVFSEALSEIFVPSGKGIEDAMKRAFAGLMNLFGDSLIQLGLAKLAFDDLITKIASLIPGGGLGAIAAGIALKVFAGSILNSLSNKVASAGSGSGYSGPSGGTTFTPFAPSSAQQRGGDNYQIYAMDAKSLKQLADENPGAFAATVKHVAQRDRDTGGSAYGVFGTAGAR